MCTPSKQSKRVTQINNSSNLTFFFLYIIWTISLFHFRIFLNCVCGGGGEGFAMELV